MPYFHAVAKVTASQDTNGARRIGVLLVNLGTPDSPTYFAVQRYLRQFLSDRRVIDTSRLIWLPLLYGVVLPLRPLRTAATIARFGWRKARPWRCIRGGSRQKSTQSCLLNSRIRSASNWR